MGGHGKSAIRRRKSAIRRRENYSKLLPPFTSTLEHPDATPGSGVWPCAPSQPPAGIHKVQGGFPSGLLLPQQQHRLAKVKYDAKGRVLAPCGCLKRTPPPPPPTHPPFALVPQNVHAIESWILDTYASSAFNVCTHQPLPKMNGLPPLKIHVKDNVTPVAIHKPSTIPTHWVDQVKKDLQRDIELGVLERVPSNTPTTWCSRMYVVGKKTGEPRRVVDLRAVNSATSRQTHSTEPPFRQASSVPPKTWRFSTYAWNGYHSIPLDINDRHVTTFLTPWGRMRYLVAPQGSVSSGDGYTFWYDFVIPNLKALKKCIDDVLGWAKTLAELFFNTLNFLFVTNSHGIIQNPAKFKWGRREIEYVGFWLTEDGVQPTQETLK